jgi:hypothetical protein
MSLTDFNLLAAYAQWAGSFFIILLCAYNWRLLSSDLKAVGVYAALSFFFQLLQFVSFIFLKSKFNNPVANVYSPIEVMSLLAIYFFSPKLQRYRLLLGMVSTALLVFLTWTAITHTRTINATSETVRDLTMIVGSLTYFLLLMKDLSEENIMEMPMFWINSSILFFFSCTFILSLSMGYIQEVLREDFVIFWIFRNFLRFGFCIVICIGIWKARKLTYQIK